MKTNPDDDPVDGMPSRAALAKEVIYYRISQLSKMLHGEDWREGIEYDFWNLGHKPGATLNGVLPTEALAKYIRDLGTLAGGWWIWPKPAGKSGDRPVFIPLDEWRKRLARRRG